MQMRMAWSSVSLFILLRSLVFTSFILLNKNVRSTVAVVTGTPAELQPALRDLEMLLRCHCHRLCTVRTCCKELLLYHIKL